MQIRGKQWASDIYGTVLYQNNSVVLAGKESSNCTVGGHCSIGCNKISNYVDIMDKDELPVNIYIDLSKAFDMPGPSNKWNG